MHPILHEILFTPMGWLLIAGTIIMLGIGIVLHLFIRNRMREEDQQHRGGQPTRS